MKKNYTFYLETSIIKDKAKELAKNERRSLGTYIETLILEAWDKWQKTI
jgi:hypothetical protein